MREEILLELKTQYENIKMQKETIQNNIRRFKVLESHPKIKEYFEILDLMEQDKHEKYIHLVKEFEDSDEVKEYCCLRDTLASKDLIAILKLTDDEIIDIIYPKVMNKIIETSDIYVYLGTRISREDLNVIHDKELEEKFKFNPNLKRFYMDLESFEIVEVPISKSEEFEKYNKIIFTNNIFPLKRYFDIQKIYLKMLLNEGSEYAKEEIVKIR